MSEDDSGMPEGPSWSLHNGNEGAQTALQIWRVCLSHNSSIAKSGFTNKCCLMLADVKSVARHMMVINTLGNPAQNIAQMQRMPPTLLSISPFLSWLASCFAGPPSFLVCFLQFRCTMQHQICVNCRDPLVLHTDDKVHTIICPDRCNLPFSGCL